MASLAWPIMLSRSGILVMAFVDIVMVGRHAAEELAYAALGLSIFVPALVTAIGLQFGTMRDVATSFGAKRYEGCGEALRRGLPWSGVTGLAAAAIVAPSGLWLALVGHAPELAREAGKVAVAVAVGLPFQLLYVSCAFFLEGTRRPVPGMVVMLGANLLNILLNWILIYGNLGMPALGAVGSGIATSAVRIAMLAALGRRPRPLMDTVLPLAASWMMIGATPPNPVHCGRVTLMAMPAATPASVALPPCSRMRNPAAVAK